jgi:hypothetical protein
VAIADVTRGPAPREALLARALVELAGTLVAGFDVLDLLTLLADRCVRVLDVAAAGLMLAGPDGDLRVMASSSEAMRVLELFELQSDDGPCPDCYLSGKPVVNQDLADVNGRCPRFAPRALASGVRSVHALPMSLRGSVIGALNLFHAEAGEMREADVVPPRPWPMSPSSPSCNTAPPSRPRSSTDSSSTPSTAASSSSKPKGWWPKEQASTWNRPLWPCATMPATTIFASSSSLKMLSAAPWPRRRWARCLGRSRPEAS